MERSQENEKAWTEKFFKAFLNNMADRIADLLSFDEEDEDDDDSETSEVSSAEE